MKITKIFIYLFSSIRNLFLSLINIILTICATLISIISVIFQHYPLTFIIGAYLFYKIRFYYVYPEKISLLKGILFFFLLQALFLYFLAHYEKNLFKKICKSNDFLYDLVETSNTFIKNDIDNTTIIYKALNFHYYIYLFVSFICFLIKKSAFVVYLICLIYESKQIYNIFVTDGQTNIYKILTVILSVCVVGSSISIFIALLNLSLSAKIFNISEKAHTIEILNMQLEGLKSKIINNNQQIEALKTKNDELNQEIQALKIKNADLHDQYYKYIYENQIHEEATQKEKPIIISEYKPYDDKMKIELRSFFDSPAESELEYALDEIIYNFSLSKIGIRLLAHQPLGNYVKETNFKKYNIRNKLMHFDFLFEIRKDFNNFENRAKRSLNRYSSQEGHIPLLAIELDGKSHSDAEQIERDKYKDSACEKLKISMLRIPYDSNYFYANDVDNQEFYQRRLNNYIDEAYRNEIIQKLFLALFDQIPSTKLAWCKCYSMEQLPEIADLIEEAYNEFYKKQENEPSPYFD